MSSTVERPTAFVIVNTNHGVMLVNRHDYRLVGDSGYGVGFQLLNTQSFDQDEVDLLKSLLLSRRSNFGPGVVAIDCGANIGVHTIEWAKTMYGWGEVIAVEAQERVFYALAGNITVNNCFNARAIWAAVGEAGGEIEVPVPNYFKASSFGSLEIRKSTNNEFIGQEIDYNKTQRTALLSIDSLECPRLDLIKIDIEGMELEALSGARKSIEEFHPQILIEKIKSDAQKIEAILGALGYKIFPVGINILAIHETDPVSNQIQVNKF